MYIYLLCFSESFSDIFSKSKYIPLHNYNSMMKFGKFSINTIS